MNRRIPIVALVALALSHIASAQPADPKPADAPRTESRYARVCTIGASVTAGAGRDASLAALLDRAIRGEHAPVQNLATVFFFAGPTPSARKQVDRCLRDKATLVVGLDALFWFAYGRVAGETEAQRDAGRLVRFRRGLRELERLTMPLVVGDIPDMRHADPRMLPPHAVPSRDALAAVNRELAQWAAAREHVLVLPLAKWAARLEGGSFKLPPRGEAAAIVLPRERAMSADRLHPSRVGQVALAHRVVLRLREHFAGEADALSLDFWKTIEALGLAR